MRKIRYSKDVDALLIELSDEQIDLSRGRRTNNYPFF
jgi:hypothetical protein